MTKSKHHKPKYPNSEWVRRRNIRKALAKRSSKKGNSVIQESNNLDLRIPPERIVSKQSKVGKLYEKIKQTIFNKKQKDTNETETKS
ncbi:MAG: hypothetical protein Unbinned6224contig1001_2 [Prokaryotic dsDNA virus sp.]|nr:MAG: hypothetical protein Unbinned6224contig1001_2 [Prokaryotic dsDNA virus sp.]|tara:strand:- start:8299 stop:8559 length:261 start_codon:yes stop_codon:yes gene_type:complete